MKFYSIIVILIASGLQLFAQGNVYNLKGEWNHDGNGHKTKLTVKEQNGNKFSGTMYGQPLINGVISGNKVTFTRAISLRQDYTGTITIDANGTVRMSGTFTQLGTNTVFKWHSEKIEKTANIPSQTGTPGTSEKVYSYNKKVEAENNSGVSGGIRVDNAPNNEKVLGWISNNSYVFYKNFDFGKSSGKFIASAASPYSGGTIEIRLDSQTGTLLGSLKVSGTNNWHNYVTFETPISPVSGSRDLYLVFKGGSGYMFNLNWFKFEGVGSQASDESQTTQSSKYDLRGEWNHDGNGSKTKLIVKEQNGNKFSGTMHGQPLINGVISGNKVTFTRAISQRQDYSGTITVDADGTVRMSGTFTQLGTNTVFKWYSEKIEKDQLAISDKGIGQASENKKIEGRWSRDNGMIIEIKGNTGYFVNIGTSAFTRVSVKTGDIYCRNIQSSGHNLWTSDILWVQPTGSTHNIAWSDKTTMTLSEDGNSLIVSSELRNITTGQLQKGSNTFTKISDQLAKNVSDNTIKKNAIGYVQFELPSDWKYSQEKYDDGSVTQKYSTVQKNGETVSVEGYVISDFKEEKELLDLVAKGKPKMIGGVEALSYDMGEMIAMLFPPVKSEKGVFMLFDTGEEINSKMVSDIVSTISLSEKVKVAVATAQVSPQTNQNKKEEQNKPQVPSKPKQKQFMMEPLTFPPIAMNMSFDFKTMTSARYTGMVSMAMEGMRLVYGEMTPAQEAQFEKEWLPLFTQPCKQVFDYLEKLIPLTSQFLAVRDVFTEELETYNSIVYEVLICVAEEDGDQLNEALAALEISTAMINSLDKQMLKIKTDIKALGDLPNATACAEESRRRTKASADLLSQIVKEISTADTATRYLGTNFFLVPRASEAPKNKPKTYEPRIKKHNAWSPLSKKSLPNEASDIPQSPNDQNSNPSNAGQKKQVEIEVDEKTGMAIIQHKIILVNNNANSDVGKPETDNSPSNSEIESNSINESVAFYNRNIEYCQKNIDHLQSRLSGPNAEKDPEARNSLTRDLLYNQAELQHQKDKIASLKTGQHVRTRTELDAVNMQIMLAESQKMAEELNMMKRAMERVPQLINMAAPEEQERLKDEFYAQTRTKPGETLDPEKVRKLTHELGNQVMKGLEKESKSAQTDLFYAERNLRYAENVKAFSETSLMLLSTFGPIVYAYSAPSAILGAAKAAGLGRVNTLYQGTVGYIEGGVSEAFTRVASNYNQATQLASAAMNGYQQGVISHYEAYAADPENNKLDEVTAGLWGVGWQLGKDAAIKFAMNMAISPLIPQPGYLGKKPPTITQQIRQADFVSRQTNARSKVKLYKEYEKRLDAAITRNAPKDEISKLRVQADNAYTAIKTDYYAKMHVNKLGRDGDKTIVKLYNIRDEEYSNKIVQRVARKMQEAGYSKDLSYKTFSNSSSKGKAGMDMDLGINEPPRHVTNAAGRKVSNPEHQAWLKKINQTLPDGKVVRRSPQDLQAAGKVALEEAFTELYGKKSGEAMLEFTTSYHPEAYRDLAWLGAKGSKTALVTSVDPNWVRQAADVTQFKVNHLPKDHPSLGYYGQLQEQSRGIVKDFDTKILPMLNSSDLAKKNPQAAKHLVETKNVLDRFAKDEIGPIEADNRIWELTGGRGIQEISEQFSVAMQALAKQMQGK
jgi:hypothetical protein